ncbi:extensin-like domain-containing protein [Sphingomonas sp. RS2018]
MIALRRAVKAAMIFAILLAIGFTLYTIARSRPQDLPWTKLDLSQPPGRFTAGKIAALGSDFAQCRTLLDRAGVRYTTLESVRGQGGQCGYADGVRVSGGSAALRYSPAGLGVACPVAAAMAMLEWNVIQPAAERRFGSRVRTVEHFGSYNCRRMYGRSAGDWSQHATADAIDIAGFVLADGTRISVVRDWDAEGKDAGKAAFLRDVRDGACDVFTTVLSPDYNAAHRDHFHLDQANRGTMGWGACR